MSIVGSFTNTGRGKVKSYREIDFYISKYFCLHFYTQQIGRKYRNNVKIVYNE